MQEELHYLRRRSFLKSSLLAAGATGLSQTISSSSAEAAPNTDQQESDNPSAIPTRAFGSTGRTLPILGMGGSAMVGLFIRAYGTELLSMVDRKAMVRHAYDSGVRYFDTARVYGESESIMGGGLKGVRENCYVATKVHFPDAKMTRQSVEKSLEQLDMDYVDCVQIHSPAIERVGFDGAMKIHAELVKLRDEGLLKYIGLTTHVAFETVLQMIETGGFDQVLLAYGYFRKGMDTILSNQNVELREQCLAKAHDQKMAIVAMKVLGANIMSHNAKNVVEDFDEAKLAKVPPAAIRWVLRDERVSMLNIGVSMPSDIDNNLVTITGDPTYTNQDRDILAEFSAQAYESQLVKEMEVT